jgi:lipase ATG15
MVTKEAVCEGGKHFGIQLVYALAWLGWIVWILGHLFGSLVGVTLIIHLVILIPTVVSGQGVAITSVIFMIFFGLAIYPLILIPLWCCASWAKCTFPGEHREKLTPQQRVLDESLAEGTGGGDAQDAKPAGGPGVCVVGAVRVVEAVIGVLFLVFLIGAFLVGSRVCASIFDVFLFIIIVILPLVHLAGRWVCYWGCSIDAVFACYRCHLPSVFRTDPFYLSIYRHDGATWTELYSHYSCDLLWKILQPLAAVVYAIFGFSVPGTCWVPALIVLLGLTPLLAGIQFPFFILRALCSFGCKSDDVQIPEGEGKVDFVPDILGDDWKGFRLLSMLFLPLFCAILILPILSIFHPWGHRTLSPIMKEVPDWPFNPPTFTPYPSTVIPVSEVCYVKPFGLSMAQIVALAGFSYWDLSSISKDPNSDAGIRARHVVEEFFDPKDPKVNLTHFTQMELLPSTFGSMTKFVFDGPNLTVYAFRGTAESLDWALDAQLFVSSALHTIAFPMSLFLSSLTQFCDKAVMTILGMSLRITRRVNLVDRYTASLRDFMRKNSPDTANVLYVGHSLGGGLAKLFAYQDNVEVVSVSGPGVEIPMAAYSRSNGIYSEEFVTAAEAELLPDYDLIPRVEASTGVKYRIMCDEGVVNCHGIDHTLCMIGVMCHRRHDAFCAAYMNRKNPSGHRWSDMVAFGQGE